MNRDAPSIAGLSGDLGWNEIDDVPAGGLNTTLLVLASGAVWASLWLLGGLAPLPLLATWRHEHA